MTSRRRALGLGLGSVAAAVLPLITRAQAQWPTRPVKIIVPYPAGGVNDVVARMLAEHLRPLLGQPVVVDNRAGAGGTIGMDAVAKADDGHTLAFAAISPLTLNPHIMKVQYDPLKDFAAVASVMYSPVYVLATARFKGRTFERRDRDGEGRARQGEHREFRLRHARPHHDRADAPQVGRRPHARPVQGRQPARHRRRRSAVRPVRRQSVCGHQRPDRPRASCGCWR